MKSAGSNSFHYDSLSAYNPLPSTQPPVGGVVRAAVQISLAVLVAFTALIVFAIVLTAGAPPAEAQPDQFDSGLVNSDPADPQNIVGAGLGAAGVPIAPKP